MTCVCCVSVVSVLVTLQTYGPVSVTLTLWMVRTLTASVAWDRASRWGLVSTQLFVCWEETDTLKTSCFFVAKTLFFTATCLFARVGPPNVHPGVELHQSGTVQGESVPHQQLHRVLRKQLDIINLTSCSEGRTKQEWGEEQRDGGRETVRKVEATLSAVFPSSPEQRKLPEEPSHNCK